ncbi:hypothetical protein AJ80_06732 [Polytolypa hystricis UAMH7299]|uniref:FCP1 homology domain-containing protein n=1 Tax=Polytolypa hystricis (strain UAMH7299) TaxID=1447883 RepID=A0A2B7XUL4_POLH7|nr:hypothetical protein AJ80_06732 [Polytolypa hystricis UAMH7299]
MNSLNILSSRVIGQSASSSNNNDNNPPRARSRSQGPALSGSQRSDFAASRSYSEGRLKHAETAGEEVHGGGYTSGELAYDGHYDDEDNEDDQGVSVNLNTGADEKSPLLRDLHEDGSTFRSTNRARSLAQRLFDAIAETIKVILSTLAAPGFYLAHTFRDENGYYSPLAPARRIRRYVSEHGSAPPPQAVSVPGRYKGGYQDEKGTRARRGSSARKLRNSPSRESISSYTSESDLDHRALRQSKSSSNKQSASHRSKSTRASSSSTSDDVSTTPRRSIRIKINNESQLKRRQQQQEQQQQHQRNRSSSASSDTSLPPSALAAADSLKSPISTSSHKMTKYPHFPAPPRPLIPPRQPSYAPGRAGSSLPQKTLVLDLDETLIHSLAKGGRMSSGHMVEVRLATPITTSSSTTNTAAVPPGAQTTSFVGPQHPILYYVHKRPHCDDFLRKICKWYKLVIFTASVQEYADPVIDWLEQERKYFHSRLYRQHCTFRNGAYIKDLSSVEPDLSKVMILDNSPMSYIFHEDNAIPIEGWINDPTDNDLLHLIPVLEAMQYVTDVRALLALRRGEAETQ